MPAGSSSSFSLCVSSLFYHFSLSELTYSFRSAHDRRSAPRSRGIEWPNSSLQCCIYHAVLLSLCIVVFNIRIYWHGVRSLICLPFRSTNSIHSGQHTYSENPRVAIILRLIGLLGFIGLGLCIAGGVLGTHRDADQVMAASLRRAGVCLYAAVYLILIPIHIGAWTYRWHLRSYRRSVSSYHLFRSVLFYRLLFLAAFRYIRCPTSSRRPNRLRRHRCLFFTRSLWHKSILRSKPQKT